MQGNAVHRRCHAMFTHPVMDIAAARIGMVENVLPINAGVVRTGQISRAAKQRRAGGHNGGNRLLAGNAGCNLLWLGRKRTLPVQDRVIDGSAVITTDRGIEGSAVSGGMTVLPGRAHGSAAAANGTPPCHDIIRNFKRCVRPAKGGARARNFLAAKWCAVRTGSAGFFRCAKTDHRAAPDQGWFAGFLLCGGDGLGDGVHVMSVNRQNLPTICFKTARGIFRDSKVGAAINRDAIVIEQNDQAIKLHMSGHRCSFVADPFHQAAITGNHIGIVINKIGAECGGEVAFSHRHANRIGKPLAERAGGRFNAAGMTKFRVTGGDRAKLAEIFDLRARHIGISGQIQERIDQHRPMPGGQHKAVTVGPVRVRRIEIQVIGKQNSGCIGHPHRHARMAGFCRFNGIHCQRANSVRHRLPFR